MKIIRLTTLLDFGGIEKRLTNIAHIQDSNEWYFCAIGKGGVAEKKIISLGKKVVCFNVSYKIPSFAAIRTLYIFFKNQKPDVVHTSGAEANFHGIIAARLANIPCIIGEELGVPAQSFVAREVFSFLYKQFCKCVVGNSNAVTDYLIKFNRVSPSKVIKIPNPLIFPELILFDKKVMEPFKMISISRLEPIKNIESVIRVIKKLVDDGEDIVYHIVGDGGYKKYLQDLTDSLGLSERIIFLGFQENVYYYLQNADLYLLTSHTEGFSNSLVEAMYSGTPVLSTAVGAATEIIQHGINGWLVEPSDDSSLYYTLKNDIFRKEKEVRQQIGRNGKSFVESNYSLEQHIAKLMSIYR